MEKFNKMSVQLWIATLMCLAGLVLVFSGFWVDPEGEIHSSVLVAFGEVVTFAGALFGVDYSYSRYNSVSHNEKGGAV